MKKVTLYVSILLVWLVASNTHAQTKLVEKIERKGNELVIPYEKYVLPNGLTLIVHEDHSDPVVHVDVTYHVGSGREEIQKSGFAHFFEHMMFEGSDNVPYGAMDKNYHRRGRQSERKHQPRPHQLLRNRSQQLSRNGALDRSRPHGLSA